MVSLRALSDRAGAGFQSPLRQFGLDSATKNQSVLPFGRFIEDRRRKLPNCNSVLTEVIVPTRSLPLAGGLASAFLADSAVEGH
jgi:hypothetical protein